MLFLLHFWLDAILLFLLLLGVIVLPLSTRLILQFHWICHRLFTQLCCCVEARVSQKFCNRLSKCQPYMSSTIWTYSAAAAAAATTKAAAKKDTPVGYSALPNTSLTKLFIHYYPVFWVDNQITIWLKWLTKETVHIHLTCALFKNNLNVLLLRPQ